MERKRYQEPEEEQPAPPPAPEPEYDPENHQSDYVPPQEEDQVRKG